MVRACAKWGMVWACAEGMVRSCADAGAVGREGVHVLLEVAEALEVAWTLEGGQGTGPSAFSGQPPRGHTAFLAATRHCRTAERDWTARRRHEPPFAGAEPPRGCHLQRR